MTTQISRVIENMETRISTEEQVSSKVLGCFSEFQHLK